MFDFNFNEAERLHRCYDIKLDNGILTVVQYINTCNIASSNGERYFYSSNPKEGEMRLTDEVFEDAAHFLCLIDTVKFKVLMEEMRNTPKLECFCAIAERTHWMVAASIYNLGL